MKEMNGLQRLDARISQLESQRKMLYQDIRHEMQRTGESLKPAHLLKEAMEDIIESQEIKKLAIKTAATLLVGFVLKQILSKNAKTSKTAEQAEAEQVTASGLDALINGGMNTLGEFLADQTIQFIKKLKDEHLGQATATNENSPVETSE